MSKHKKQAQQVTVVWLDPGDVRSDFCVSVMDLFRVRSDVIAGRVVLRSGGGITRGRNRAVNEYLTASSDEWMLFIDSDMKFTVEDFDLVLNSAHPVHRPVVGGLCFAQDGYHAGPFATLVPTIMHTAPQGGYFPMWNYPANELVECDATGCAFLLIHRSVLEKIQRDVGLGRWSWFMEHPQPEVDDWTSEDVAFCELIKACGFPIYVHTGAKIGHVKGVDYVLTEQMYHILQQAAGRANT